MDADTRLDEIRNREQAATKGPWEWRTWPKGKEIHLQNTKWDAVMTFTRWGMNSAQPQFCTDGLLVDGRDLLRQNGREVDHPDAEFIVHSREDIAILLAAVDARDAVIRELGAQLAIRNDQVDDLSERLAEAEHSLDASTSDEQAGAPV